MQLTQMDNRINVHKIVRSLPCDGWSVCGEGKLLIIHFQEDMSHIYFYLIQMLKEKVNQVRIEMGSTFCLQESDHHLLRRTRAIIAVIA